LEVLAEPVNERGGQIRVVVVIDAAHDFFGVPGSADLAVGVAGVEQTEQLGAAGLVETLIGFGQQAPAPVQRVVLAAPVPAGVVLDPAAALIELGVGQLDDMEQG